MRSAAGLVVLREQLDVKAVNGERVDTGQYCAISNTLRRVLATVGLQRVPKLVPTLQEYIADKYGDSADAAEATP